MSTREAIEAVEDKLEYIRYICYRKLGDSGVMNDDMEGYMQILKLLGLSDKAKAEAAKNYYGEHRGETQPEVYCYSTWRHLLRKPNVL